MIYGNPLDLRSYAIWAMRRDFLSGSMTPEQLAKALDDPKRLEERVEECAARRLHGGAPSSRSIGLIERGTNRRASQMRAEIEQHGAETDSRKRFVG